MMGSGCSPPVHGPINLVCVTVSAAIIIGDPGSARQTAAPDPTIGGIAYENRRTGAEHGQDGRGTGPGIGWSSMTWLITGGAGYIGAHVARAMAEAGERVVALDDLSSGVAQRLPEGIPLVQGSSLDGDLLKRVLSEHAVTGVVHLAARKQVGESVEQPTRYYQENVGGLATLLEAVAGAGVRRFLFSSSAAVYGNPDVDLITEDTPCAPMSPYGETKLAGEWLVRAAGRAHGIATVCLRYFNVAGAVSPELADTGVFNVIPMVFDRLTRGEAPRIFGGDYPTPDGTGVRDYIHVADLAEAHLAAAHAAGG